jgi:hypothetical protein
MNSVERVAGRDLDALVAEMMEPRAALPRPTAHEARRRRWGPDPKRWTWYNVNGMDSPLGWWYAEIGSDCPVGDREPVEWVLNPDREPSVDFAAAWLVVERMQALGYLVTVAAYPPSVPIPEHVDQTCVTLCRVLDGVPASGEWLEYASGATADTAPLAICLAALAATTEGSQTDG